MKTLPAFWFEPRPWIDGRWQPGQDSRAVVNPATGAEISRVERADPAAVSRAIEGAATAQRSWRSASASQRGHVLVATARLLLSRKEAFATVLTAEQGKPYEQSVAEVEYAASFFQWFGEEARRVSGRIMPHPDADREFFVEDVPAGVAGLITPWNFPLAQGAKKIAAALAAGCAAVWKPAELTPLVALALGPVLAEAGLPSGALQIVPGRGAVVGRQFAEHPAIRVLSLTGSTATGAEILAAAASGIKRVSLELGGNAPFIVLPDADLDAVAGQLVQMKLFVSGQVCVTANRIFVPASHEERFTDLVAERLSRVRVGNGLGEAVDAGPLIHKDACAGVGKLVEEAVAAGARIVAENRSYEADATSARGSFFPPTLVAGVRDDMRLAREEIFGPVIPLLAYENVAEAVCRANDTPYGLAAYVYGRDIAACRAVAERLEVGIVGVNEWRPLKAEIPFGGVKASGIGVEGGHEGIYEFLDTRVISLPRPVLPR